VPDKLDGIIFSEILADNPNNGGFNTNNSTNGNGSAQINKEDEFIEFVNTSNATIDIGGYQVWSDQLGLLHTFDSPTLVAPGEAVVVVGEFDPLLPANTGLTNFYEANGPAASASGNGGFLEDGEDNGSGDKNDTLYLVDLDGNYIRFSYGATIDVPTTLPAGFPAGGSLQGSGEILQDPAGAANGIPYQRNADGDFFVSPTPTPTPGVADFVCFATGTLIMTDQGEIAVEDLRPDMRLLTRDCGYVPLRALRATQVDKTVLRWNPDACAIAIPAGALGNTKHLIVSPAHRVLCTGAEVSLICGASEALVPAHHFVGYAGVTRVPSNRPVTYYHLLCDDHQMIQSDGIWTESLFLGDVAHAAVRATEEWVVAPDCNIDALSHAQTARIVLKRHEAQVLLSQTLPVTTDDAMQAA
jgi:hypothetical protein